MTTTTTNGGVLCSRTSLCPPPLVIQKKSRRATFRRRIFRKSTQSHCDDHCNDQYVFGPLDDIIDEITSDIWESPPDYSLESSALDWAQPLKAPSSWTVTPLPVSRTPKHHPLTIRKNRNSRSSASGSSFGDTMAYSRNTSQDESMSDGPVGFPHTTALTPWPLLDTEIAYEPVPVPDSLQFNFATEHLSTQQALENVNSTADDRSEAPKRRGSKLRLFTNGFPRLRRTGTGGTEISDTPSPTNTVALATQDEADEEVDARDPSDAVVEAYVRRIARNGTKFGSIMGRIAKRLPSPCDYEYEASDVHVSEKSSTVPTTLRVAVKIFPEVKILTEDAQELSVAVDIEGVLHNRKPLPDTTIDVIFVVDNGYYVTKACLERSLDAVNGALYHLGRGDRLALYTTHCTHHEVTGNRPDLLYPIRPFCTDTEETFHELTTRIAQAGTQAWDPPRPNPSMKDVILSIARSIEGQNLKADRTHVILLSPASHVLHDVSTYFPNIYIHRINPAILPYRREPELDDTVCNASCCKNVFVSNSFNYKSVSGRIKRLLKNARSEKPVGELTQFSLDLRVKTGCEIIECHGTKDILHLRLGQFYTLMVRIRVTRAETEGIDLGSCNPVLNSALEVNGLRQELMNVAAVGATKVHLFDVQVLHKNSLHRVDYWQYKETPVLIIRELGGLAPPLDTALEVYKRQYFHKLTELTTLAAKLEAANTLAALAHDDQADKLIERMVQEITCHQAIQEYEHKHRQKLPLCPGPIDIEGSAHEWLVDLWNRKKNKRKGVAAVKEEDIAGLTQGMSGLERLG